MKILLPNPLYPHLPLYHLLLLFPWSTGKGKEEYQEREDPEVFDMFHEPSTKYEQYRRRIKKNVIEFCHVFSLELDLIQKSIEKYSPELALRIASVAQLGTEFQAAFRSDSEGLQMSDGYEGWREREKAELTDLMQNRLHRLQNPKDCNTAPKVFFSLLGGGFGADLHILVYVFIVAYGTKRTMIVDTRSWRYDTNGWGNHFSPFSDTCTDSNGSSYAGWSDDETNAQVLELCGFNPFIRTVPFSQRTLPKDLAPRLKRLHGNPFAWWAGQFLKYILRPRRQMLKMLEENAERRGLERPYVGVHVRRTDKKYEASYVPVDKYMIEVDMYYRTLELSEEVPVRRIYLATDEPRVISEMEKKYHDRYVIFCNSVVAISSNNERARYNEKVMIETLIDIFFLSLSDYLVCTFSSNLCRVAYEIMQIFHVDASDRAYSMDRKYYADFELKEIFAAIYAHPGQIPGDMRLDEGDVITDIIDLHNGYSTGFNTRSNKTGMFPTFKVDARLQTFDFPSYHDDFTKR